MNDGSDFTKRTYHHIVRDDGSVSFFYTLPENSAHHILYDSPNASELAKLRARIAELERDFAAYRAANDDKVSDAMFDELYMKPMCEMKTRAVAAEGLVSFAKHSIECADGAWEYGDERQPCTCGYDQARAALKAVQEVTK